MQPTDLTAIKLRLGSRGLEDPSMPPSKPRNTLSKSAFMNALAKMSGQLTPATREAADKVLGVMATDGHVSVAKAHQALFPFAETKSASAQLSKLVKAIEGAAARSQCDISVAYEGAKSKGAGERSFAFRSAP